VNKIKDNKLNDKLTPVLLSLLYIVSCIFIPLIVGIEMGEWLISAISLTVSILSLVAFSKVAKGFRHVFIYALILGATLFIGGFVLTGVLASVIGAVCMFSYLCFKAPIYITVALPAIAYLPALAITRDPVISAAVFFTLPASLLCVYAIKSKRPRISAICHVSVGFCISFAAIVAIAVFKFNGSISREAFFSFAESAKEMLGSAMREAFELLGDSANETLGINVDLDLLAENVVTVTFNLLPAIIVLIANALSYLIHTLSLILLFPDEKDKEEIAPMLVFEMSIHSAFIFIAAVILSFALTADSVALYGAVADNLVIILMPGFIITALAALRFFVAKRQPSCFGTLLYLGAIFMIASFSYPVLLVAGLAGSIVRIVVFFKKRAKSKQQ